MIRDRTVWLLGAVRTRQRNILDNRMIGRVAVWLLIAFVLFTVFRQFDNSATAPMNAEQTSYTQFMQDAKDGKIRRVDVQGRKIT